MTSRHVLQRQRMFELLDDLSEDRLKLAEYRELETIMRGDRTLRRLYLRYLFAHSRLCEDLSKPRPKLDVARQVVPKSRSAPSRPTDFLFGVLMSVIRPSSVSTAIVAVLFYGAFAVLAWNLRPLFVSSAAPAARLDVDGAPAQAVFGTLKVARNCRWTGGFAPIAGERLGNESLELEKGCAEITFDDGTTVCLEAPAEFHLQSSHACFLSAGKLTAAVPKQARGFAVETATARIVDLGTEFGMVAEHDGSIQIEVFEGEVSLAPSRTAARPFEPMRLVQGEARRVSSEGVLTIASPCAEGFIGVGGSHKLLPRAVRQATKLIDPFDGPRLNESLWSVYDQMPSGGASVTVDAGQLKLVNRGYLILRGEFRPSAERPLRLAGKFSFQSNHDYLQILTRADGVPDSMNFGEAKQGIDFLVGVDDPQNMKLRGFGDVIITDVRIRGDLKTSLKEEFEFEVVDGGSDVSFTVRQVSDPSNSATATARVVLDRRQQPYVVLYNRERTETNHVVYLDEIVIEMLSTRSEQSVP